MTAESCPTNEQLDQFARGLLPDDAADELVSHLDSCTSCEQTVCGFDTSVDPFLSALRKPVSKAEQDFLQEFEFQDAVASIRERTSGGQNTVSANVAGQHGSILAAGESIRDYELIEIIGRGGMGVVYKARHQKLDRIVALKVLAPNAIHDESMVERFQREMQAVGKLNHPNIVSALDAGEVDGLHYLVMEFVDGENLSALLRSRGAFPVADACELIRQAAIGLQDVHEHGLVHRDLKPGNLMVTASGIVKILDLGLARLHAPDLSTRELTTTGQLMGTIDYISPEQADNTHDADIRADIYSLGATLHALLTGRAPFGGDGYGSAMKKLVALSTQSVARIDDPRDDIPAPLADLVERMLAKAPEDRPQIPADVAEELLPFAADNRVEHLLDSEGSVDSRNDTATRRNVLTQSNDRAASSFENNGQSETIVAPAASTRQYSQAGRWWKLSIIATVVVLLILNGGQVIRIATGKGLLVIESKVPDIEVTVLRGDAARIVDHSTKRKYELEIADDYRVVVTEAESGVELRSDTVTISRGGRRVFVVNARPTSNETAVAPEDYLADELVASDRQTAEWVFGIGAVRVWVRHQPDSDPVAYTAAAELTDKPFRLTGLEISLQSPLQLAQAERLSECDLLEQVWFQADNMRFSDSCIKQVAQLHGLQSLGLSGSLLTANQIRMIVEFATQLQTLRLDRCSGIDDTLISHIATLAELRHLSLNGVDLNAIDLTLIYSMTSLSTLDLRSCNIEVESAESVFNALPECTIESDFGLFVPFSVSGAMLPDQTEYTARENVEWAFRHGAEYVAIQPPYQTVQRVEELPDGEFRLTGGVWTLAVPIPSDELPRLAGLRHIEGVFFNMREFNVGDDFVSAILAWRQLEDLGLIGGDMNHDQLGRIVKRFTRLRNLSLSYTTGADDEALSIVSSLKELESLSLTGTAITDAGLRHVHSLVNLKSIQLQETAVTEEGIAKLASAIPECRIESDFGVLEN